MRIPSEIGPYRVLEPLGDGGSGLVVRAQDRESGALVALKLPKGTRLEEHATLRRETGVLQLLSRADVRAVARLVAHGELEGRPWYAMDHIEGSSLRAWLSARRTREVLDSDGSGGTVSLRGDSSLALLTAPQDSCPVSATPPEAVASVARIAVGELRRTLELSLRLAEAVAQLHTHGVVHGDLSPQNILMREGDDPVLIDFGASLVWDSSLPYREGTLHTETVRGTPGYLAPESLLGEPLDARSDLYSLGCVLYELLSGKSPFAAPNTRDVLRRQLHDTPKALNECVDGIPGALSDVVRRLLEREPSARLAYSGEVCQVLSACLDGPSSAIASVGNFPRLLRSRVHGRANRLDGFEVFIRDAEEGRGRIVLVEGEEGIGKSRFLQEIGKLAARRGLHVLAGQGQRSLRFGSSDTGGTALALFGPILSQISQVIDRSSNTSLGDVRRPLEQIARFLSTSAGEECDQGEALNNLFLALARVGDSTGLVLLVDDVDAADEVSLAFLRRYEKDLARTRVLVVASVSADGKPEQLGFCQGDDKRIVLDELSEGDARWMLQDLLGEQCLPDGLLDFIRQRAGGNPFFVSEYVRAALAQEVLTRRNGGWCFTPDSKLNAPEAPAPLEHLLDVRLARLSLRAAQTLVGASICNHELDDATFEVFVEARQRTPEILAELVAHDFIEATSAGTYRFKCDKLRPLLERRATEGERIALHRRLALHGETNRAGVSGGDGALGYHWANAGEPRRAVTYLESAARVAAATNVPERASELFRLAASECAKLPESPERNRRLDALEEAEADALIKRARHRDARARLLRRLERTDESSALCQARLARKLGASCCTTHDYADAANYYATAERALAQVTSSRDTEFFVELVQVGLGRFDLLYFSGKLGEELHSLVQELRPLIEQHGTAEQACTYYFMAVSYTFLRRRYAFDAEALVLAQRGVEAAEASGNHRRGMAEFILGGALLLGARTQCEVALQHFDTAARDAARRGDATLLSRVRTYEAVAHLRLGHVDAVAIAADAALRAAEAAGLSPYVAAAHAFHGWVAWRCGDSVRGATLLNSARERWKSSPHRFPFSNLAIFPLLDMAQSADDLEAATALLLELPVGLPALPEPVTIGALDAIQVIRSGETRAAVRAVAAVVRLAGEASLV